MKIVMIGQKGIPTLAGGVERHVQELSTRLVATGHEVVAYTRPWYTDKNRQSFEGVKLVSLPSIKSKHFDAISHTTLAILHAAFVERPDVIHIHAVGPALLTWLAQLVAPKSKIVVTFHCIDRQHQKWGKMARLLLRLGEWSAMKFADEVIAVSKTLQHYAYEAYSRKVSYIPNGISTVKVRPANLITKSFGLESAGYYLTVARLVRHKGIHHLIKAYQHMTTDKKLVIVGNSAFTDDYVAELHQLAAGNPNIIFTGLQTGVMLEELFSNAYAFVLPSESEGLPIAVLEAAAYGKTVLASDIPANLEIVQHCGMHFTSADVADLTAKLNILEAQPELVAATGETARRHVLKYYHWDDITEAVAGRYTSLMQVSSHPVTIHHSTATIS